MSLKQNFEIRPIGNKIVVVERGEYDRGAAQFVATEGPDKGKSFPIVASGMMALCPGRVDNMGVCEVVNIGPDVVGISIGDIGIIDWSEMTRRCPIGNADHFFLPADAFRCWTDPAGNLKPRADIIITKSAPDRMNRAMTGQNNILMTPKMEIDGFPCKWGRTEKLIRKSQQILGVPSNYRQKLGLSLVPPEFYPLFHCLYQEVTHVGENVRNVEVGDLLAIIPEHAVIFNVDGVKYHMVSDKLGSEFTIEDGDDDGAETQSDTTL